MFVGNKCKDKHVSRGRMGNVKSEKRKQTNGVERGGERIKEKEKGIVLKEK